MLMIFSTLVDFFHGNRVEKCIEEGNKKKAKKYVISSVIINLCLLGFFKYTDFFIENINILVPSMNAINDFDNVISTTPNIPRYKYIHYKISPIEYENMASFINLYKAEINGFTAINTQSVNKDNPFIRDKATQYLIQTAREKSNVNKEMLEMEEIKILNQGRLKNISNFFRHKSQFISTINKDFKTFQFYLRQYSGLREITSLMKPTELRNGDVLLSGSNRSISFNDYFVLYKHFHAMIKYMISIISYHEQQFFNKIYGLQSNIESYANIVNEVLDYAEKIDREKEDTDSLNESCEEVIVLDEAKSIIDKNFKTKGKLSLSSFKKIHITEDVINKYKNDYPMLKHVRCKDTKEYICDGYMWLDNNKLACMVGSCEYRDDHSKYIVSLEVTDEYKGYGLSKQLLAFAVNDMKCSKLSVNKNNEVAKKVYDDFGFKVFHEDDNMYYMEYKKSLNESYFNSYDLINGNYAAHILMNDDTSATVNGELDNILNKNNLELVEPKSSDEEEFKDINVKVQPMATGNSAAKIKNEGTNQHTNPLDADATTLCIVHC